MATKPDQKAHMVSTIYQVDEMEVIPENIKAMSDLNPREEQKEWTAEPIEDLESIQIDDQNPK
ncbi:hypothetical protein TorRG33x02_339930 [Trema orientale]|uniref:Uncharacterized protein n=1 Tax=Trema orientale TaxID=63057 RepID=A0A2P5AVX3_TREOI|nr:hypothetical protein TorRG33x02_339930 [Trema orientale]